MEPFTKPLSDESRKRLEAAEKLFASKVVAGRRIRTLASFRTHVTNHDGPVIVLFKNGK